jgi:putative flavoprotein involved in K+ transport
MDRPLDAAVIGAGWAGLGVSYVLAKAGLSHRVLERGRIGETWLTQRWDSFCLNTPKFYTVMPGDRYDGPDPEAFYARDESLRRRNVSSATLSPDAVEMAQ